MDSRVRASEPQTQKDFAVFSDKVIERKRLKSVRHEGVPRKWGPYLSEPQLGTVREDYS